MTAVIVGVLVGAVLCIFAIRFLTRIGNADTPGVPLIPEDHMHNLECSTNPLLDPPVTQQEVKPL